jgi:dienelactone hydrolase
MRAFRLVPIALLSTFVAAASCSSSSNDQGGQPAVAFSARFDLPASGAPDILQVPFPSDLFVGDDGAIHFDPGAPDRPTGLIRLIPNAGGTQYLVDAFARTKGYGVYGGSLFELDGGTPDKNNFPSGAPGDCTTKGSPIVFFDVDAGTPVECRASWNDDSIFKEVASDDSPPTPVLVVRTARGVVLPEGHKIAILITSALTSKGASLAASASFAAMRDGVRDTAGKKLYGDAIDAAVGKLGLDKQTIVDAAVYTTGHVTDDLRNAREIAGATPLPTLKWGVDDCKPVTPARFTATTPLPAGWNASLDDWLGTPDKMTSGDLAGQDDPDWGDSKGVAHDAIQSVGTGVFDAPNFLMHKADGYADPDNGVFFHDASGKLAVDPDRPTMKIWVTFSIPKGPMPAGGWPVVVNQHGMGGQRSEFLNLANTFAHHGWATVAIELVQHGTRSEQFAPSRGDSKSNEKRSTSKYDGPDGFTDRNSVGEDPPPTDMFGDLYRVAALRDQFRQSAIDHTTLVRLLQSSPTIDNLADGGVMPKIDGTKIAYVGDSLGGIMGALVAGIEPGHSAYVLNVPGGGIASEIVSNAPVTYPLLRAASSLYFGFAKAQMTPDHPFVEIFQHVVDGGDPYSVAATVNAPIAIAGKTPSPRNVVLFEALADELVANEGTEGLARAMGIPVVTPHRPMLLATLKEIDGSSVHDVPLAGTTGALIQTYPATHGSDLYNAHGQRTYAYPSHLFGDPQAEPFPLLSKPIDVDEPYLDLQVVATKFIDDAFSGKAPTITWTKAPATIP